MHWKDHLIRKNKESDSPGGMFQALKSQVIRVRKDNEPPTRDLESFSRYMCDLCHASGPLSELRQCVICGRWGCPSCWHDEYYLCKSCGGIMRLLLLEIPSPDKKEKTEPQEPLPHESTDEHS